MSEIYDIHLFDRTTGRYSGTQNCLLSYDTENFDATMIIPPKSNKVDNQWWLNADWPYWNGSSWELRIIEE